MAPSQASKHAPGAAIYVQASQHKSTAADIGTHGPEPALRSISLECYQLCLCSLGPAAIMLPSLGCALSMMQFLRLLAVRLIMPCTQSCLCPVRSGHGMICI